MATGERAQLLLISRPSSGINDVTLPIHLCVFCSPRNYSSSWSVRKPAVDAE